MSALEPGPAFRARIPAGWAAWRLWPPYGAGCCGSQAGFPGATGAPYAAPEPSSLWLLAGACVVFTCTMMLTKWRRRADNG